MPLPSSLPCWHGHMRSIPACAGEPSTTGVSNSTLTVYPRVCGGTTGSVSVRWGSMGLSPRVRGNRNQSGRVICLNRSIPACAGEPTKATWIYHPREVYPRVCGGTPPNQGGYTVRGLSPRVRGNRRKPPGYTTPGRSIPACAGEPAAPGGSGNLLWVYPRVCGGTYCSPPAAMLLNGLSPRVRGNRLLDDNAPDSERSIPACAGEPYVPGL